MIQSKVFHKQKKKSRIQSSLKTYSVISIALKQLSFFLLFHSLPMACKEISKQNKNMSSSSFPTYDNSEDFSKSLQSTEASTKLIQLGNNDPKLQDLW